MEDWTRTFFKGPWLEYQLEGPSPEQTNAEVDFLVTTLGVEPGARLLDVPCGAGRHSIELAARGFRL